MNLLAAQGHQCAIVAPRYRGRLGELDDPRGARELRIPSLPFPLYPAVRLSLPQAQRVGAFLDAFAPDLVHVHTEGPLGAVGRGYALRRGLPLVTSFHTDFPAYSRQYGLGALEPAVWRWLHWFHSPARLTLTPGTAICAELVRRGVGHAAVWGRGVETALFHPGRRDQSWRRWLAGGDDTVIALHVGRLAREKNLDVLIEAWQLAYRALGQRVTFVVAGEGPYARRIAARLPFIRLLGFLPRQHLARLYACADLCVFPSHTETCGLVALEAMSAGVPVIAADAGGFRDSVAHGETGLLVSPHDPLAYLEAMIALVRSAERRFALAAAARERAVARDVAGEDAELLERYRALIVNPESGVQPCAA